MLIPVETNNGSLEAANVIFSSDFAWEEGEGGGEGSAHHLKKEYKTGKVIIYMRTYSLSNSLTISLFLTLSLSSLTHSLVSYTLSPLTHSSSFTLSHFSHFLIPSHKFDHTLSSLLLLLSNYPLSLTPSDTH